MPYLTLPDNATTWSILGAAALAALAGFANWWHRGRPARDRAEAGWDAILGVAEVKDRGGGIAQKGQPGLVHRVTHLEQAVVTLADQQTQIKDLRAEVLNIRSDVDGLTATVAAIIADKWETGARDVLKAVEQKNKGVIDAETD